MTRRPTLFVLWAALALAGAPISSCQSIPEAHAPHGTSIRDDVYGARFLLRQSEGVRVNLPGIDPGCELRLVSGGTPSQAGESLALSGVAIDERPVWGPDDLVGCVRIDSGEQALEYLRFFSSMSTVHLFAQVELEFFPMSACGGGQSTGASLVCVPEDTWRRLGMDEAAVRAKKGVFVVRRYVKRLVGEDLVGTVLAVTQRVARDGEVRELSTRRIDIPEHLVIPLSFPLYM